MYGSFFIKQSNGKVSKKYRYPLHISSIGIEKVSRYFVQKSIDIGIRYNFGCRTKLLIKMYNFHANKKVQKNVTIRIYLGL